MEDQYTDQELWTPFGTIYRLPDGSYSSNINLLNPILLDGVTVTPNGNRTTTYDDWKKSNELELAADIHGRRVRLSPRPVRRFIRKVSQWGLKGLGKIGNFFNNLFTSGAETDFGLTSPFSDMDRKAIQTGRRRFGRKVKHKIEEYSPFLSPTSYLAAIYNDSWDPRYGAKIISLASPEAQLGLAALDLILLGRNKNLPKDIIYNTKKGLGHLVEDFEFPENGRVPLKYGEPTNVNLDSPFESGSTNVNNIRYKYYPDRIDKLMVDDMIDKFKQRFPEDEIHFTDPDGGWTDPTSIYTNELEKVKDTPYYVGDIDDPRFGGLHYRFTHKSYVDRGFGGRGTGTHESIMHGSERWGIKDLLDPYKEFVDKLNLPEDLTANSRYEARATMGELKRDILRRILKKHPELPLDIKSYRPHYEEYINNLSDRKLRRMFRWRGYGLFYNKWRKNNPTYVQDLRNLLLNGF